MNFVDSDLPLVYRFGHERALGPSFLEDYRSTASETSVLLPQGIQDANYTYLAAVSVSDVYCAVRPQQATAT